MHCIDNGWDVLQVLRLAFPMVFELFLEYNLRIKWKLGIDQVSCPELMNDDRVSYPPS